MSAHLRTTSPEPKRRGRVRRRHTVARVVWTTLLVLGLTTGLSVVYLYRDLNDNLMVKDYDSQLTNRPERVEVAGPREPINILVMGSDTREGVGNNIDGLTGQGERSDTTILFHLSADRTRAYGVSIPRDSMVTRPDCKLADGTVVPGGERVMWNEAYNQAGPACTIQQFEQTTGVRIDHYVVVNFAGFRDMVDAIGGVEVCIPQTVDDREYGIYLEAGTREVTGKEALAYVRERHGIGNGSDIGRMKRQQAFVASMAAKVVSAGTLANPFHLVDFLRAATRSLQLDPGLGNLTRIAKVGKEFKDIGLDKIQFVTVPWQVDPIDPNRVVWAPRSAELWRRIRTDEALTPALLSGRITAAEQPNASPDSEPTGTPSPSDDAEERRKAEAAENGLCA